MYNEESRKYLQPEPFSKDDPERARDAQQKSVAKRKENRTMKQILIEKMKYRGCKEAGIDALIAKYQQGDLAAFDRVRALLNEQDDDGRDLGPSFNLVVSQETADILSKIVK